MACLTKVPNKWLAHEAITRNRGRTLIPCISLVAQWSERGRLGRALLLNNKGDTMINNNDKCNVTKTHAIIADLEPPKKKRGHGYTKPLCKKAKAKRKR